MNLANFFNQQQFDQYVAYLKSTGLSDSSIQRKLSSIATFQKFLIKKGINPPVDKSTSSLKEGGSLKTAPFFKGSSPINIGVRGLFKKLFFKSTIYDLRSKPLTQYLLIASLLIIISGIGVTLYRQAITKAKKNLAYTTSSAPVYANRFLSFQGRLTDSAGNPITSSTSILFELYNTQDIGTGTSLYTSSTGNSQVVTPDENGIFAVTIGKTHGTEIPNSVFTENPAVFLQITAGGEVMDPRQPIATVAYAINSETLQGLPPSASGLKNTVLVIDNQGNLNLGETSPTIKSTSGTLGIEGQAILLTASNGSGGDIEINPDASGIIKLTTEGNGSTAVGGFIDATNANLSAGNLYSGTIRNTNRGYNFLSFRNYDIGTTNLSTRFSVDAYGNTLVGGTLSTTNISIGNTLLTTSAYRLNFFDNIAATAGSLIYGNGSKLVNSSVGTSGQLLMSNGSGAPAWINASAVGSTYTAGNGLSLVGNQFKLGGLLSANTDIGFSGFSLTFSDAGSTFASFSSAGNTFYNPTSFTSAGDVSMAYDLNFTNSTSSTIRSNSPLYIQTESPYANLDINLTAANSGKIYLNSNSEITKNLTIGGTFVSVGSTNLVTNLNADLLDGLHSSSFIQVGSTGAFVYTASNGITQVGNDFRLNLGSTNTWTGPQTFGNLTIGGTFVSVGSTNLVTNLNANYLNGIASSGFLQIGSTGNFITTLTNGVGISIAGTGVSRTINVDYDSSKLALTGNKLTLNLGSTNTWTGPQTFGNLTVGGTFVSVGSTNLVTNLNSDLLDGLHASSFLQVGSSGSFVYTSSAGITQVGNDFRLNLAYTPVWTGLHTFTNGIGVSGNTNLTNNLTIGGTFVSVGSTNLVTNLNADLLDGLDSTAFLQVGNTGNFISNLTAGNGIDITGTGIGRTITNTGIINTTDTTLTRSGSAGSYTLGLNLGSTNTWTALQNLSAGATISNLSIGGTFLSVGSTNLITNLNANYLNGLSSSSFLQIGQTGSFIYTSSAGITQVGNDFRLNLAYTPVWTGLHTFTNGIGVSGTTNLTNALNVGGTSYFNSYVGIGTSNFYAPLSIAGTSGDPNISGGIMRFDTNSASNNVGVKIGAVSGVGSSGYSYIQGIHTGVANDANLSFNPTGGNVGIGTTSPTQKLTVNGNINIPDATDKYISFDSGTWTRNATIGLGSTFDLEIQGHSNIIFRTDHLNVGDNGERMRIDNTGVGITGNLVVRGGTGFFRNGIGVTGNTNLTNNLTVGGTFVSVGSTNLVTNLNSDLLDGLHASSFLQVGTSGSFVYTSSAGITQVGNDFRLNTSYSPTWTALHTFTNGVGVSGTTNLTNALNVGGTSYFASNVGIGTTNPNYPLEIVAVNNNGLNISGSSLATAIRLGGTTAMGIDSSGYTRFNGRANKGFVFTPNDTNDVGMMMTYTGNVGIGTTNPTSKLSVVGDANISTNLTIGGTFVSVGSTNLVTNLNSDLLDGLHASSFLQIGQTGSFIYTSSAGITQVGNDFRLNLGYSPIWTGLHTFTNGIGVSGTANLSGSLNVGGTAYFSNKVGIGTTNPGTKFDIQSDYGFPASTGSTQPYGGLRISPPTASGNVVLDMGINSSYGAWLQSSLRNDLSSNYPIMINPNGGNVGIGITNPQYKLDVNGNIGLNGNAIYTGNAQTALVARGISSSEFGGLVYPGWGFVSESGTQRQAFIYGDGTGTTPIYEIKTSEDSGTNWYSRFMVTQNGKVGIGTTNPLYALDIGGTGSLRIGGTFVSVGSTNLVTNLNADLLDGYHASTFLGVGSTGNFISTLTNGVGISISGTGVGRTIAVDYDATKLGLSSNKLTLNLGSTNTWTALQTFTNSIGISGTAKTNGYLLSDAATDNLLVNGDFEQGNYAWNGVDSIGTGTSNSYSGNNAAQVDGPSNLESIDYIPIDPTQDVIQLEAYVKKLNIGTTAGIFYFGYYAYDANKTVITTAPCGTYCYFAASGWTIPNDNSWHKVSATRTGEGTSNPAFPVGTRFIRVLGLVNYGGSSDSSTLIDHITLKRINNGPLFVGNNFSSSNATDQYQVSKIYTTSSNQLTLAPPTNGTINLSAGTTISSLSIGGTFVSVGSTNLVTNLNSDLLDGLHASSFLQVGSTGNFISTLTNGVGISISGTGVGRTINVDYDATKLSLTGNKLTLNLGSTNTWTALQTFGNGIGVTGTTNLNNALNVGGTSYFASSVGIGTQSPNAKLGINVSPSTGVETNAISFTSGNSNTELSSIRSYNSGSYYQDMRFYTSNGSGSANSVPVMTLEGYSGYIGIGTTDPTSKLHVVGNGNITGNLTIGGTFVSVGSTNLVTNLNADLLDGLHSSSFLQIGSTGNFISNLTAGSGIDITGTGIGRTITNTGIINATNGTLTRSGSAGSYTLGLNLGNANTWTGLQTFNATGAPFAVGSNTVVTNLNADLLDGVTGATYYKNGDVTMNTNPFGGRQLYINSIDNAMHAADKKWYVTTTRHLISYGGETYPKLNPDYVTEYTLTGTGTQRVITNTPKPGYIVVYDGDTLKYQTTNYTYDSVTGTIDFNYTPTGTIRVYPGQEIPQYLDSPVDATLSSANPFDGSYESTTTCPLGYYLKVRVSGGSNGYTQFGGYPYGNLYLSYYYTGTPDKAEYRVYNYAYRPHTPGWKKMDFGTFTGSKSTGSYIETVSDSGNYGRTIMEFIIYGHDTSSGAYTTSLSEIDWKLDRPNLSTSGSTVTKYGTNKLYYDLNFGDQTTTKASISPTGLITGTQLISTVSTGTSPLTVASTTKVTNLNADLLDGLDSSQFLQIGNSGAFIYTSSAGITQVGNDFRLNLAYSPVWTGLHTFTNGIGVTGTTNLSGNLNVGGTGYFASYLGINTNTPTAPLDIKTGSGFTRGLRIGPQNTTVNDGSYIEFTSSSVDNYGAQIGGIRDGGASGSNNALVLRTANTENMRISSSGNVGIGTTNPTSKLHVVGNGNITGNLTIGGTFVSVGSTNLVTNLNADLLDGYHASDFVGVGSTGSYVYSAGNGLNLSSNTFKLGGALTENTNLTIGNTSALFINATSGNVGIGTTSPSQKLDVNGKIAINGQQTIYNAGALDDTNYKYSLFVGTGGTKLSHTSSEEAYYNLSFGVGALYNLTTGNRNTAIGTNTLSSNTTGSHNFGLGYATLDFNISGNYNSGIGDYALFNNSTGSYNLAIGPNALMSNIAGSNGVAIGAESQRYANDTTTPWTNYNTSIGFQALRGNSAVGSTNTGNYNTAIGYQSLLNNTSGEKNTATGYGTLLSNTSGKHNSAQGYMALQNNTTGNYNTAQGYVALYNLTGDYSYNTALGYNSGRYYNGTTGNLTSANQSLFLGASASALANGDTNEIVIGYNAIGNGSNTVTLGNDSITNTYLKGNINIGGTLTLSQGASNGYILTSDASGNSYWAPNTGVGTTYAAGVGLTLSSSNIFSLNLASANTWTGLQNLSAGATISNLSIGGTFLSVGSTNLVTNLNANYLNGIASSQFLQIGSTGSFISNLTAGSGIDITGTGVGRTITNTGIINATNGTLTRSGSAGSYTLGLNLGSTNTWTGLQNLSAGATISNLSIGGTFLSVGSTNTVSNLSADLLDGYNSSYFINVGQTGSLPYDNYNNWKLTTNGTGSTNILTGNTVNFVNGVGVSLVQSGSTITINNTGVGTTYAAGNGLSLASNTFSLNLGSTNTWTGPQTFGNLTIGGTFVSVGSTNLVTNLNANYLGGLSSSAFLQIGSTGSLPYVNNATNGTLTRSGSGPYTLGLNLGSTNVWTALQTFTNGIGVSNTTNLSGNLNVGGTGYFASNVGIGTTNPQGKLHVVSGSLLTDTTILERSGLTTDIAYTSLRATSTKTTNMGDGFGSLTSFAIQDDTGVVNTIGSIGAVRAGADNTGDLVFQPITSGNANERMRITSGGNIGIGTTNPTSKLHVVGNGNITGNLTIGGTFVSVGSTNLVTNLNADLLDGLHSSSFLQIGSTGSFVYTASNGITQVGNDFRLNLTNANTWTGLQNFSAGATISNLSVGGTLTLSQGANNGYILTSDASGHSYWAPNTGIGTTYAAGNGLSLASNTFSLNLGSTNVWTALQTFTNGIGVTNTANLSGNLNVGGTGYFADNVGVGTTDITGKFTVAGSSGNGRSVSIDNREIKFRGDGVAHMSILGPDTGNSFITFQNTSGNSATGTAGTDLFTILSTGNIGIGTTNPSQKLQITTSGANDVQYGIRLQNPNNSTTGASIGIAFANDTDNNLAKGGLVYTGRNGYGKGDFLFLQNTNNDLSVPTLSDAVMAITNGGSVGIGTTAPSKKLTIIGDGSFSTNLNVGGTLTLPQGASNGYILTSDANGNATWTAGNSSGVGTTYAAGNGLSLASNTFSLNLGSTNTWTALQNLSAGATISNLSVGGTFLSVGSTNLVTNLNADLLDGLHASSFLQVGTSGSFIYTASNGITQVGNDFQLNLASTNTWTGLQNLSAGATISNLSIGGTFLSVGSTNTVTNLSADLLDGLHSSSFLQIGSTGNFISTLNNGVGISISGTGVGRTINVDYDATKLSLTGNKLTLNLGSTNTWTALQNLSAGATISNLSVGGTFLSIGSTNTVTNLSADLLDGLNSTAFLQVGSTGSFITTLTNGVGISISGTGIGRTINVDYDATKLALAGNELTLNLGATNVWTALTTFTNGIGVSNTANFTNNLNVGGTGYFASYVGIGTTNPSTKLEVVGDITINSTELYFKDSTTGGPASLNRTIHFNNNDNLVYNDTDNSYIFSGDAVDYFTIKNGNVGIGTTSPTQKLHVVGKSYFTDNVGIGNTPSATSGKLLSIGNNIYANSNGEIYASSIFDTEDNTAFLDAANSSASAASLSLYATGSIRFNTSTSNTHLINGAATRIQNFSNGLLLGVSSSTTQSSSITGWDSNLFLATSGNVGIGTTNPGAKLEVAGTTSLISNNSGSITVRAQTNGVSLASGATSWASASDIRLKNIISNIDNPLDRIMQLSPIIYSWKSDPQNIRQVGLIAQEVQNVLPEAIAVNDDGYLGIRYTELIPLLTASIQELNTKLEGLSVTTTGQINTDYDMSDENLTILGYDDIENKIASANYSLTDSLGQTITRISEFNQIVAAKIKTGLVSTTNLIAKNATISNLKSKLVSTTDFIADNAVISNIKSKLISTTDFIADNAVISNIKSNTITSDGIISPLADIENLNATNLNSQNANIDNLQANTGNFSELKSQTIIADQIGVADITGKSITSENNYSKETNTEKLVADEAVVGKLYADQIYSKNGSIGDLLTDKISSLREEIQKTIAQNEASQSALLAETDGWYTDISEDSLTISSDVSLSNNLIVGAQLLVNGNTQLGNTFINGIFNAGDIAIKDNYIETTNTALYIQPSQTGTVHIMGDVLTIADNGNVTVNGNLAITGSFAARNITADEINTNKLTAVESTINDLSSTKLNIATDSASTIIASESDINIATNSAKINSNATAGTATLPAGKTELIISTDKITPNSMVYLTPLGSTQNQVLYVKSKDIASFTISLDNPLTTDLSLNWWIIN